MCKSDNKKNEKITLLFVGDQNLGKQGFKIVSDYFKNITCIIWNKGDTVKKEEIEAFICSKNWDILISFYNDLIFKEQELSRINLAFNIHPSSPLLRGVAYDTLPLIKRHNKFGVTLHYITKEIDAGKIIDVLEEKIPKEITYGQFRLLTQKLCLKMLKKTVKSLSGFDNLSEIYQLFNIKTKKLNINWSSTYFSRKQLNKILDELRKKEPNHRVFKGKKLISTRNALTFPQ